MRAVGLRVALLAGTLRQGGAEKQLIYMTRALLQAGVDVRVYSLTRGEYYESTLQAMGVQPKWVGQYSSPIFRLMTLIRSLHKFKPHVLQAAHFYANLYVSLSAPVYNAVGIGTIRSDIVYEMEANRIWGKLLVNGCGSIIANSQIGRNNAVNMGIASEKAYYLPNVIDLADFDKQYAEAKDINIEIDKPTPIVIASAGRMLPAKRYDRFINALAIARQEMSTIVGMLIGDGPEKENLQLLMQQKGLSDEELIFLGRRDDVPALLKQADIFLLTSDHEGFPNVLLEAMAARLPIITTSAGDASKIIQDGLTGYIVSDNNVDKLVACILRLARSKKLRNQLGQNGRRRVEQKFIFDKLAENLITTYQTIANQQNSRRLLKALSEKKSE